MCLWWCPSGPCEVRGTLFGSQLQTRKDRNVGNGVLLKWVFNFKGITELIAFWRFHWMRWVDVGLRSWFIKKRVPGSRIGGVAGVAGVAKVSGKGALFVSVWKNANFRFTSQRHMIWKEMFLAWNDVIFLLYNFFLFRMRRMCYVVEVITYISRNKLIHE